MTDSLTIASAPTVAVLIPVLDDDGRLAETLASLCNQRVPLVAVVVDDGSRTPLRVNLDSLDFPVVVLRHETNRGVEHALETGLAFIRRQAIPYIARLDNGDRCAPGRLTRQRELLERNPGIALVGSAVEWRDDEGTLRFARQFPTGHEEIVRAMHHTVVLIHPAVMFRASVIDDVGGYSTRFPAAEDYELFFRIARRHRVANLPDVLLTTRFDPNGVSMRRRRRQLRSRLRIQLAFFRPGLWQSWYGVAKTLALFIAPYALVVRAKAVRTYERAQRLAPGAAT